MGNKEILSPVELPFEEAIKIVQETLGENILKRPDLLNFRLPDGMHLSRDDEWHGEDHGVKVFGFGHANAKLELARERKLGLLDQESKDEDIIDFLGFGLALMGHDCGRFFAHEEEQHGEIGAERFELFFRNKIPDTSLEEAMHLTRKHVPPDEPLNMSRTYRYLKNADALDRTRTNDPAWTLNPDYLRDDSARLLVSIARRTNEVYYEIRGSHKDGFSAAVEALAITGLVK